MFQTTNQKQIAGFLHSMLQSHVQTAFCSSCLFLDLSSGRSEIQSCWTAPVKSWIMEPSKPCIKRGINQLGSSQVLSIYVNMINIMSYHVCMYV